MFEVEMKFKVPRLEEFEKQARKAGITFGDPVEENDLFFRHPSRDFAKTDEALRLRERRDARGTVERFLTYKGPKIDPKTKTRREVEIPVQQGAWTDLLEALGFVPGGNVHKIRRYGSHSFQGFRFDVTLDTLPVLSDRYVELETVVPAVQVEAARGALFEFAQSLDLTESVRASYLSLVSRSGESAG